MWQQNLLSLDLPAARFDGIFANAVLFPVPGAHLPRVLQELRASLKPGGVLFSSNPRGHGEEGWSGDRYGVYHDLAGWRRYMADAVSWNWATTTGPRACLWSSSPGWRACGAVGAR